MGDWLEVDLENAEKYEHECHRCCGTGTVSIIVPACCGNLTQGGECRGDCCIPEEKPDECPDCSGRGQWR